VTEQHRRSCIVRRGADVRALDDAALDSIDELLATPDTLVWLDIIDPDQDDLALLAREFDVHPLAIEDLQNRGQRAKLDTYGDRYVIVAYEAVPRGRADGGDVTEPAFHEIHLFAGRGYLVTVRWAPSPAIEWTRERFVSRSNVVGPSVGRLLYVILDAIVDGYFPLIDALNDHLDELEPTLLSGDGAPVGLQRILRQKRTMLALRHVAAPLRDVANSLLRREAEIIDDEAAPYYNDLFDHLIRVIDSLDLLRDLVAATLDASLASTSNSLNLVVKRLTAVTVILMVPTLITGIYGMNLELFPSDTSPYGFWFALGLMAVALVATLAYFRRHGWF
jgi:magnesium transporter